MNRPARAHTIPTEARTPSDADMEARDSRVFREAMRRLMLLSSVLLLGFGGRPR